MSRSIKVIKLKTLYHLFRFFTLVWSAVILFMNNLGLPIPFIYYLPYFAMWDIFDKREKLIK